MTGTFDAVRLFSGVPAESYFHRMLCMHFSDRLLQETGAQEGSKHDWNETQAVVCWMEPATMQTLKKNAFNSHFCRTKITCSINLWNSKATPGLKREKFKTFYSHKRDSFQCFSSTCSHKSNTSSFIEYIIQPIIQWALNHYESLTRFSAAVFYLHNTKINHYSEWASNHPTWDYTVRHHNIIFPI